MIFSQCDKQCLPRDHSYPWMIWSDCSVLSHKVRDALDKVGEYYADRFKWKKAAQYFLQSRNLARFALWLLVDCASLLVMLWTGWPIVTTGLKTSLRWAKWSLKWVTLPLLWLTYVTTNRLLTCLDHRWFSFTRSDGSSLWERWNAWRCYWLPYSRCVRGSVYTRHQIFTPRSALHLRHKNAEASWVRASAACLNERTHCMLFEKLIPTFEKREDKFWNPNAHHSRRLFKSTLIIIIDRRKHEGCCWFVRCAEQVICPGFTSSLSEMPSMDYRFLSVMRLLRLIFPSALSVNSILHSFDHNTTFFWRWNLALELAEQYDFPQVEGLLARFASSLISKNKHLEAVELYRVANKPQEAAILTGLSMITLLSVVSVTIMCMWSWNSRTSSEKFGEARPRLVSYWFSSDDRDRIICQWLEWSFLW
jgi:hypothetical protein